MPYCHRDAADIILRCDSASAEHNSDFSEFPRLAPHLQALWACEPVQQQYRDTERLKYQKVKVFFDKLDEVSVQFIAKKKGISSMGAVRPITCSPPPHDDARLALRGLHRFANQTTSRPRRTFCIAVSRQRESPSTHVKLTAPSWCATTWVASEMSGKSGSTALKVLLQLST